MLHYSAKSLLLPCAVSSITSCVFRVWDYLNWYRASWEPQSKSVDVSYSSKWWVYHSPWKMTPVLVYPGSNWARHCMLSLSSYHHLQIGNYLLLCHCNVLSLAVLVCCDARFRLLSWMPSTQKRPGSFKQHSDPFCNCFVPFFSRRLCRVTPSAGRHG